jgi:hypothetical protein
MRLSSETKEALLWASGFYIAFSAMFGAMIGCSGPDTRTCEANSIQELLNVPYRVACELTRRRWE